LSDGEKKGKGGNNLGKGNTPSLKESWKKEIKRKMNGEGTGKREGGWTRRKKSPTEVQKGEKNYDDEVDPIERGVS